MYEITVPVINSHFRRGNPQRHVQLFKKMGVKRVLLAVGTYETDKEKRENMLSELKDNVSYLKQEGFEVGAWLWTFWVNNHPAYEYMKFTSGDVSKSFVCPSCDEFRKFAGDYIKSLAECGVDLILYDDDYRYGHMVKGQGAGCVCENHIRYAEEILGEKFPEDVVEKYLLSGKKNKYRSAWIKANGHFLLKFAEDMRNAVDEVNPSVRVGVCACMSVWDFDGASPAEIARTLAGSTKPYLRLIGAPYWANKKSWGNRLQDVIELERMERSWCGDGMEIVSEGDVYPRPRYSTPASFMEGFDTALRADGTLDGIQKYAFDYTGTPDYELGYIENHIENLELYKKIDDLFGDKTAKGVRVYEVMQKFEDMDIPKAGEGEQVVNMFFSPAARMLAGLSVPTIYEGEGVSGVAFGENAKYLPDSSLDGGMILDIRGAQILSEKGIDVGIEKFGEDISSVLSKSVSEEYFPEYNEYVPAAFTSGVYDCTLSENVTVQSYFKNDETEIPASYIYENKNGQRFFVFLFEGYFAHERLFRQYTRQKQLAENIEWLSGKKLPAVIGGHPDLYVMCKEKDGVLSVGLWNFFADKINKPVIKLDKKYTGIRFANCEGDLSDDTVTLSKLGAYEYAFFEVK